jgi:hypothetical protein
MKRFVWITLLAATGLLSACAGSDETDPPGANENQLASEEATPAQRAEALKINPCALVRCRAGTQCEVQQGHAVCVPVPEVECRSDKECRLFSNYCEGCACVALSTQEVDPVCKGDIVACLVDPCRNAEAQCVAGQCVLGGAL